MSAHGSKIKYYNLSNESESKNFYELAEKTHTLPNNEIWILLGHNGSPALIIYPDDKNDIQVSDNFPKNGSKKDIIDFVAKKKNT